MARRLTFADRTKRRVVLSDTGKRPVDTANLASRLGAAEAVAAPPDAGSPVSFLAIREELARTRRSSGGRPGLRDTGRKKIPVSDEVWRIAQQVADDLAEPGFRPSTGQVAGVMLNIAARELLPELTAKVRHALKRHEDSRYV